MSETPCLPVTFATIYAALANGLMSAVGRHPLDPVAVGSVRRICHVAAYLSAHQEWTRVVGSREVAPAADPCSRRLTLRAAAIAPDGG
jgi:hypothetical protein